MSMAKAKPFVKWAGGKSQLIDEIQRRLPFDIEQRNDLTYIEPFVGGGAVLFWILQRYPSIQQAVINDVNPKLICTYRVVKEWVDELIRELHNLQDRYLELNEEQRKEFFLAMRKRFNNPQATELEIASLFIFLNRTCFNGLYRVNSKGLFNVPFGRYANPTICNDETLRLDSELLQRVIILNGDYETTEQYITPNTFMYLDEFFDNLYLGYIIDRVYATRMVNANASKRGRLTELMMRSNYQIVNKELKSVM